MNDWVWTTILLLIFSLIVIPLGFKSKFLRIQIPKISCGYIPFNFSNFNFPCYSRRNIFSYYLITAQIWTSFFNPSIDLGNY